MIKIYTDGAYSPSRNMGGWAFIVTVDDEQLYYGFLPVPDTTNNRMEVQAVIEAVKWAKEHDYLEITIITDSMYVIGSMDKGYKRNVNLDLWEILDELVLDMNITWEHVKGHSGNKFNELCDIMAVAATKVL